MSAEDAEERRLALQSLSLNGGGATRAEIIERLRAGLGDEDWRVRKEAVTSSARLVELGDALFELLIEGIVQRENVGLRNSSIEALARLGRRSLEPLLGAMEKVPAQAQKFLVEALGELGELAAVPALIRAVEGADPNTTAAALDALSQIGGPDAERALRAHLRHEDPFQRMAALEGLERLRARLSFDELEPLLHDRFVLRAALGLLGGTGDERAIDPLVDALGDRSSALFSSAIPALLRLSEESVGLEARLRERLKSLEASIRQRLRATLVEGDLKTRQASAHLLALSEDAASLPAILGLAGEGLLSPAALESIEIWGPRLIPALFDVNVETSGLVRAAGIELLSTLVEIHAAEDTEIIARLRRLLHAGLGDDEPLVRRAALRAMAVWARPDDVQRLVGIILNSDDELALLGGAALDRLAREAPEQLRGFAEMVALDEERAHALLDTLAAVEGEAAFERLSFALRSTWPRVRRAAVNALAKIGGRKAADEIQFALMDDDLDVRSTAARALGTLRSKDGEAIGVDALLRSLETDEPLLLASIARALGNSLDPRAVEPLRRLIAHGEAQVSIAALEAARRFDCDDLLEMVRPALLHPDEEVARQALRTLADEGGTMLAIGLEHPSPSIRSFAIRLLASRGEEALLALIEAHRTREDDPDVRAEIDRISAALGEAK